MGEGTDPGAGKECPMEDEKIIAVPFSDPTYNTYHSISDLPAHIIEEMRKIRATRVLELNANHKAFAALKDAYENDKDKAKQLSKILASLAELMAGVEIDDPAEFVAEVSELF